MERSERPCPGCGEMVAAEGQPSARCHRCGQSVGPPSMAPPLPPRRSGVVAPPFEPSPLAAPPIESSPLAAPPLSAPDASTVPAGESHAEAEEWDLAALDIRDPGVKASRPVKDHPLRRLSSEEKSVRRARRNVVMLVLGFAVLVATLALLLHLTGG